jgi:hypothetical protein
VRGKTRGGYRVMKLIKEKKREKIAQSFTSPEKDFFFIFMM